jgi:hypothetical protein
MIISMVFVIERITQIHSPTSASVVHVQLQPISYHEYVYVQLPIYA